MWSKREFPRSAFPSRTVGYAARGSKSRNRTTTSRTGNRPCQAGVGAGVRYDPGMTTTLVTIDVPADERTSKEELAREVRLVWILDLVRRGRISVGKGAELVGLDRWQFAEVMADHGVPTLAYPASELDRELAALER